MCFNTNVEAPAPRNLAQETGDTLQTQINLAPAQLEAYQNTAPGYAETDVNILGRSLFGNDFNGNLSDINRRLTDEAAVQSRAANTAQREADIADVQRLSPEVLAAQRAANPELFGNLDALDAAAAAGVTPGEAESAFGRAAMTPSERYAARDITPGIVSNSMSTVGNPTAIEAELERQARAELALGDQLSEDEQRLVRVQSRSAADARGRGFSGAALADEVLASARARQERLDSRRNFATGANATLRSGQTADRSYGLAKDNFRAGIDQFNVGNRLGADQFNSEMGFRTAGFNASRTDADRQALLSASGLEAARRAEAQQKLLAATQARLSTFSDPFAGVLGRSSTNAGSNANLFGNAAGTAGASAAATRGMFDPMNSYAADLYNTNFNSEAAANIATANNSAGLFGALIGGGARLGGAAIMACWLARAVYGVNDDRWLQVRAWMLTQAPEWLLARYLLKGPAAAQRARRDLHYRAEVRALFDRVLALNPQTA